MIDLRHGDCLEVMKEIPSDSIDFILCDLPYGTTSAPWDSCIPLSELWEQYRRIIKEGGHIALFGSEPFSSSLRNSNISNFRYDWIWDKKTVGNPLNAHKMPLKTHEIVSIFRYDITTKDFYKNTKSYFVEEKKKVKLSEKEWHDLLGTYNICHYCTMGEQFHFPKPEVYEKLQSTGAFSKPYEEIKALYLEDRKERDKKMECPFTYNPQGIKKINKKNSIKHSQSLTKITRKLKDCEIVQEFTNYPKSIIQFKKDYLNMHPTQKPVALLEYLIKTYTNEGELVLDNCMGSGSTGVACLNTGRNFIGIERDDHFFNVATERIKQREEELQGN